MRYIKFLMVIFSAIFLLACGGGGVEVAKRKPIILKDQFVNLNYEPTSEFSYFSPSVGTLNVGLSTSRTPKLVDGPFPNDIIAVMQFSGEVVRYNKMGQVVWRHENGYGRFVSRGDNLIFTNSSRVGWYDILNYDGEIVSSFYSNRDINFIEQVGNKIAFVYNEISAPVEVYEWDEDRLVVGNIKFSSTPINYSRSAKFYKNILILADTFGHKLIYQNMSNGVVEFEINMLYPNDISVYNDYLYVVEEHFDRVRVFDLLSNDSFIAMAPPASKLWNSDIWYGNIDPIDLYGADCQVIDGEMIQYRSYASIFCSGRNTLYAPNGIEVNADGMLIADTDNARIVWFGSGGSITELAGLNNPTKVFFVQ